jgi:hypothetical protein
MWYLFSSFLKNLFQWNREWVNNNNRIALIYDLKEQFPQWDNDYKELIWVVLHYRRIQ